MRRIDRRDLAESAAMGALTFAWYAMPDAVGSRRARAWLKTALMLPVLTLPGVQARRSVEEAGARRAARHPGGGSPDDGAGRRAALDRIRALVATDPALDAAVADPAPDDLASADPDRPDRAGRRRPSAACRRAVLVAVGALLAAGGVAGTLAAERGIHRLGQRLGARGVRLPHTRIGVVAGLATAALTAATAGLGDDAAPADPAPADPAPADPREDTPPPN